MKQMVMLSGKGGTGKTTVAASLAHLAARDSEPVIVDADVDAPNLALVLRPQIREDSVFYGGKVAVVDGERCTRCGRCVEVCRYSAVVDRDGLYRVESISCEGCASCFYQCPAEAIEMHERLSGRWYRSDTRFGPFLHAQLNPGGENSGQLVSTVRQQALALAHDRAADWIIVDGPPGIGCPVIASVTGVDLVLLVCEPTISGLHDLRRILQVTRHFGVPAAVSVNKSDINLQVSEQVAAFCREQDIPLLAQLPYDDVVVEAMRQGMAVTEMGDNPVARQIGRLWEDVRKVIEENQTLSL